MSLLQNLLSWLPGIGKFVAATPAPAPVPASAPTQAAAPTQPPPAAEPATPARPEDSIFISLKAITDLFPAELKTTLRKQPSEHVEVYIPRALIQPQLASGAVRITFAQLRAVTPEIFFTPNGVDPDTKLQLPLEPILRRIMPARRNDQRQPAIPVNVPSIFTKAGDSGVRPGAAAGSGGAEPWYSQRRLTYEPEQIPETPTNEAPSDRAPSAKPKRIAIPLSEILPALPAEIQQALQNSAPEASIEIPVTEIATRIRSGRLRFQWSQLKVWCPAGTGGSIAEDKEVELPLAAVVPLFLAARETSEVRKKVAEVDSRIPDLFGKAPAPEPVSVPPATPPPSAPGPAKSFRLEAPAPAFSSPAAPESPATPPAPPTSAFRLEQAAPPLPSPVANADPHQSAAASGAPADFIRSVRALDGVTGAFLATADGLLIAGDVPDSNDNLLAAFAPTLFSQAARYSEMAKLGVPEAVVLQLTRATVHLRRAGKLHFGVLTSHGAALPVHELDSITASLKTNT